MKGLFMGDSIPMFVFGVMLINMTKILQSSCTVFHACWLVGFHQWYGPGFLYALEVGMWAKLYLGLW